MYNQTTRYMLPAIEFNPNRVNFDTLKRMGFINCYVDFKNCPIKRDSSYIYVVFKPNEEALLEFNSFYEYYSTCSNFVEDFCIDDRVIVLVFKIEKWVHSYTNFKHSKFSLMDKKYAELFKTYNEKKEIVFSEPYYAIHKHKVLKKELEERIGQEIPEEYELVSRLEKEKEVFEYERK